MLRPRRYIDILKKVSVKAGARLQNTKSEK